MERQTPGTGAAEAPPRVHSGLRMPQAAPTQPLGGSVLHMHLSGLKENLDFHCQLKMEDYLPLLPPPLQTLLKCW